MNKPENPDNNYAAEVHSLFDYHPNSASRGPRSGAGRTSHHGEAPEHTDYRRLNHLIVELEEIKLEFATTQQEWESSQRRIELLESTNAFLRHQLVKLAQRSVRARHLANHDNLTGLPNRGLLLDRLKQAIVRAARQHKQVGLLLLDLDDFKGINDTLGHIAGDKLLQQVAQRLSANIRGADTACRYGGDEFVILLPDVDDHDSVVDVVRKLQSVLEAPYEIEGETVTTSASIGIAMYPDDAEHDMDLLKHADMAMYLCKTEGVSPSLRARRSVSS